MLRLKLFTFLTIILVISSVGCSSGAGHHPVDPPVNGPDLTREFDNTSGKVLWGLWDITLDTSTGQFDIVPLRNADFHLNAVSFLEPPALSGLTIDYSTLNIDTDNNRVEVDVILNHPFPGANHFSGFDVRGIVMMPGAEIPFSDWTLIFPGRDTPHLENPDGYTRWWNPKEFPGNGIFGFQNGMLGTDEGPGFFTATVNGYKYFADDLDATSDPSFVPGPNRGKFAAGSTNRRNYKISFGENHGDFLHFQYAVDASWEAPYTMDNPAVPDDFPISANAVEGYYVDVIETENTLYWLEGIGMGGNLKLDVNVYTWRPDDITRVTFEAPGIISAPQVGEVVPGSGGGPSEPAYSTYQFDIAPDILNHDGFHTSLITVETAESYTQHGTTTFFGPGDARVCNYLRYDTLVSFTPPLEWKLVTGGLLSKQPATDIKEMSVVGGGPYKGVYFFGEDYKLYRYDLLYQNVQHATTLAGFFGYDELQLYGAPETLGRFEVCMGGQFVASSISAAPSPTFLGGLKRDYAFFFNEYYSQSGQLPTQIGIPDPSVGYFEFIDVAANWAPEVEDAKIYWIQVDDPDEPAEPEPGITVILGVYQYGFSGNPFTNDVAYLTPTLAPAGDGDGKVDITSLDRFAVDADPSGVTGSTDLIVWLLETDPPALECFSVVSADSSGDLNVPLTTIHNFYATPRDIEVIPAKAGGYGTRNWVVVLEEGTANWSIETFDQHGTSWVSVEDVPGYPICMDVDPVNYRIHIWFTPLLNGPVFSAVLQLSLG